MIFAEKIISKLKVLHGLKDSIQFRQEAGVNSVIEIKELDGENVALKKIKRETKNTMDKNGQVFFREVIDQILCDDPSVLPLRAFSIFNLYDKDKDKISFYYEPCLATKFCEEGMLSKILTKMKKNKKLSQKDIQTQQFIFAYGIAKGMRSLYLKNMIHRDLKSENIFISKPTFKNGNIPDDINPLFNSDTNYYIPYIADLGLSKIAIDDEQSQQCGTYYYLAPEVMNSKNYSFPIDVYSYAIILLNIFKLEEKPVYKMKNRRISNSFKLIQFVSSGGRPDVEGCTEDQKRYLGKLWCKKPEERDTFVDIVKYLENPGKDFIFTEYDPKVIKAYKKYLEYQDDTNNKYDITQEEYYRLNEKSIPILLKQLNSNASYNIQNSIFSSHQEEVNVDQYVSSFINLLYNQKPNLIFEPSRHYLQNGILSEEKGNYESAKIFYLNAIKRGSIQAATNLSILLLRNGDTKSKCNGYDLLEFAAEKKNKDALFYFGYLLAEGFKPKGVEANKEKAAFLLEEAGKLGHKRGFFEAASIYHELAIQSSSEGNQELAIKQLSSALRLYKKSYEKFGDEESQRFANDLQSYLEAQKS